MWFQRDILGWKRKPRFCWECFHQMGIHWLMIMVLLSLDGKISLYSLLQLGLLVVLRFLVCSFFLLTQKQCP
ncbi:hypothetical protein N665_0011s0080 [Sinapis alba]|nr:hypothetical protein N665_0011s0080 [Sinapis alba]